MLHLIADCKCAVFSGYFQPFFSTFSIVPKISCGQSSPGAANARLLGYLASSSAAGRDLSRVRAVFGSCLVRVWSDWSRR